MTTIKSLAFALLASVCTVTASDAAEVRFAKQLQINNLPSMIVESRKLFEERAAALGEPDLEASWITFANGGAAVDALISGNVEFVSAGVANFGIVWSRTRGNVKGVSGVGGVALPLLSRNPDVHSLDDFGPNDRIAVPTVRVSNQAVMMSMALERAHGPEGRSRLDEQTVQLGHADALQALLNPQHEVNSHFSSPPYSIRALKDERIHEVFNSNDLFDEPLNSNILFATTDYYDENPIAIQAIREALAEADAFIEADPDAAAEFYLEASGDTTVTKDDVVALLQDRGTIWSTNPQGTLPFVQFMADSGLIPSRPETLEDMIFPGAIPSGSN